MLDETRGETCGLDPRSLAGSWGGMHGWYASLDNRLKSTKLRTFEPIIVLIWLKSGILCGRSFNELLSWRRYGGEFCGQLVGTARWLSFGV